MGSPCLSPARVWHHTSRKVSPSLVCPSLQRPWGHLFLAWLFFVCLIFFILGGGRVAWGEKQIWRHKEKSEGGIRGISHLQIYLLIWKGSQLWWQAEKSEEAKFGLCSRQRRGLRKSEQHRPDLSIVWQSQLPLTAYLFFSKNKAFSCDRDSTRPETDRLYFLTLLARWEWKSSCGCKESSVGKCAAHF